MRSPCGSSLAGTYTARGCGMPPAASCCSDPLPNAGVPVTVWEVTAREVTLREAAMPAPLASATPLLPTPCPRGSGALSSNRSFQSHPSAAQGHVSARGPFGCSRHGSWGTSAAGRHPGSGKSTGCVSSSPCLSFILTVVALINRHALVAACKTVLVAPGTESPGHAGHHLLPDSSRPQEGAAPGAGVHRSKVKNNPGLPGEGAGARAAPWCSRRAGVCLRHG